MEDIKSRFEAPRQPLPQHRQNNVLSSDLTPLEGQMLIALEQHRTLTEADLVRITGSRRIAGSVHHLIERMTECGKPSIVVTESGTHGYVYRMD